MKIYIIVFVILSTAFLFGCYSYKNAVRNNNVSFIYNPSSTPVHPEYAIYHKNDSVSTVYIELFTNELWFNTKVPGDKPEANLQIHYKLIDSFKSNSIKDSATHVFEIQENENQDKIVLDIEIKSSDTSNYILDIIVTDLFRDKGNQDFIYLKKKNKNFTQNFLVTTPKDDHPLFHPFVKNSDQLKIEHNSGKQKLFISHYGKKFNLPAPPFSIINPKPYHLKADTSWQVDLANIDCLQFTEYGMYHIRLDTNQKQGVTIFNFGEFYPEIKTQESLIEPIRYLTTSREFKEYMMFENKKNATDNYWAKTAGNVNRARELIRIYYNRVKYANLYFSSHTEGWRTDRGMMYLIYGSPKTIYKSDNKERWIYGSTQNLQTMTYTFHKVNNPYSDNDFQLERSEIYKIPWYQAIETWRDGRAYSIVK